MPTTFFVLYPRLLWDGCETRYRNSQTQLKRSGTVKAGVWDAMEQRKQLRSKLLSLSCWIRRFFLGTTQEFLKSKGCPTGKFMLWITPSRAQSCFPTLITP